MKTLKTVLIVLSVLGNLALAALTVAAFTGTSRSLSYYGGDEFTISGACIVSAGDGGDIVFAPAAITLAAGKKAHLHYAAVRDGVQSNIAIEALYDRSIVSLSPTGYGIVITALAPGETVLQTVTAGGIRDVAVVTVTE